MSWSFRTNGNFIDFVHIDETSLQVENTIVSLHNTSKCVDWSLPEDTTRINFTIDEVKYNNILVSDIDFDGVAMDSQDDFETGIEAMFPNLAGGGTSSYLVYTALFNQAGTSDPTATVLQNTLGEVPTYQRLGVGNYELNIVASLFVDGQTIIPPFMSSPTSFFIPQPITDFVTPVTGYILIQRSGSSAISVQTFDSTFTPAEFSDVVAAPYTLQIFVYP